MEQAKIMRWLSKIQIWQPLFWVLSFTAHGKGFVYATFYIFHYLYLASSLRRSRQRWCFSHSITSLWLSATVNHPFLSENSLKNVFISLAALNAVMEISLDMVKGIKDKFVKAYLWLLDFWKVYCLQNNDCKKTMHTFKPFARKQQWKSPIAIFSSFWVLRFIWLVTKCWTWYAVVLFLKDSPLVPIFYHV